MTTASTTSDQAMLDLGRKLFAGPCDFLTGVASLDTLPPADRPEICFAGRSNVGKSSLLNAITGRRSLARTSNTPGRTQEINYFAVGDAAYLVDLPGYGFAKAPKASVSRWQDLMRAYLAGRPNLRRAFLLIDARHGLKPVDTEIVDLFDRAAVTYQPVLTKADKVSEKHLEGAIATLNADLARSPAAYPQFLITSSQNGLGIDALRAAAAEIIAA